MSHSSAVLIQFRFADFARHVSSRPSNPITILSTSHHVAGVLCVAITHSEKLLISGSEIGAITIVSTNSGRLVKRLESHRGLITCVKVSNS